MSIFRKFLAACAGAVVAMASGVVVAHGDSTPSVYTTPGGQISNGRLWNTACEKYASNVVRCRANIWATTVRYVNGRYVQKTGWTFNNLSYLPSPRASWATNNLGRSNPNWTSGGRRWRTECDTSTTGRGACRSYALANVVRPAGPGGGYVNRQEWVFNNVVLFSTPSIPAVTTVPPWIIDQSRLSFTGLGPLQVGTSIKDLRTLGYFIYPDEICGSNSRDNQYLENRGIDVRDLNTPVVQDVNVRLAGIRTVDGAQVGMTLAQLKSIYGASLLQQKKYDIPADSQLSVALVKSGANELVFTFDVPENSGALKDSDVVNMMVARKSSPDFLYDGC